MSYRITLNINGVNTVVNPKGLDKLRVQWNRENGKVYYRKELQGELVFTGNEFTQLYNVEKSNNRCQPIPITIERACGAYQELYQGNLLLSDGTYWVDGCRMEIKASKNDNYTILERKWNEKINMLNVGLATKVASPIQGTLEELTIIGSMSNQDPFLPAWDRTGQASDQGYSLKENTVIATGIDTDGDGVNDSYDSTYRVETLWIREVINVSCNETLPAPWILVEDNCSTGGNKKYAKAPLTSLDNQAPPYNEVVYYEHYTVFGSGDNATYDNGIHLKDLITYLVTRYFPGMLVKSNFFQINPDTATTINYVTGLESKVIDLLLFQKSDIKKPTASQNATRADITLQDLLNVLEILFNVKYEIEANTFRLEHLSWYSKNNGLDLTLPKYNKYLAGKFQYSYEKDKMPRSEEFGLREAKYPDFVGVPIVYDSLCVNQDENNNKASYKTSEFVTDIQGIIEQKEETSNLEGIAIIATQKRGTKYVIVTEAGILETSPRVNNSLAFAQLQRDYQRHGRVMYFGKMNNFPTTFSSIIKSKKGVKLAVPLCCGETFDPNDIVTTMIGEGEVDNALFNLVDGMLELELFYDAE